MSYSNQSRMEKKMTKPTIEVGQKWKTNDGEIAEVVTIFEDGRLHVRIAGAPFLNILAADGSDIDMGPDGFRALATIIN